ncbi:MAG: hypothetical protein H7Z38_17310 [Rubrivivax sp.]|nr:hypothetical protein [Pyrinomonadaceae bacterium]
MKAWALSLLLVVLGSTNLIPAFPQGAEEVSILKFSWSKERISQRPSVAEFSSAAALREQALNEGRLATARNTQDKGAAGRAETTINRQNEAEAKARQTDPPRDGYRYKVTLRNDGLKTIKSIDWDYLFLDPMTQQEVARHQFTSDDTIKPGKSKEIGVLYLNPPVKTVKADTLGKKGESPYKEQVLLARIQYSDGSVWQRP